MTTKLDVAVKRELNLRGKPYTLTITPDGLNLVAKGKRKGYELAWMDLISGDAALATALNASLARGLKPDQAEAKPARQKTKGRSARKSAAR
jgi:hypothetical protein